MGIFFRVCDSAVSGRRRRVPCRRELTYKIWHGFSAAASRRRRQQQAAVRRSQFLAVWR